MKAELVANVGCITGENPLWDPEQGRVYWTDIPAGRLFWLDPSTGRHEACYGGPPVGGFTLQENGELLLFMEGGAIAALDQGGELTYVVDGVEEVAGGRFNDVAADPRGRVFCGTMPTAQRSGRLYLLGRNGSITVAVSDAGLSNGLGFSPDHRHLYHTDSWARVIHRYDYDAENGALTNRTVFARAGDQPGVPDGLTVDADGCVWSARWDGGCIVRYAPDGAEDARLALPVPKVSSVTFGGADYRDLYVTTAGGDRREAEGAQAGGLFRLRPGSQGVPELRSLITIGGRTAGANTG